MAVNMGKKPELLLKCGRENKKICGKIELTRLKCSSCALGSIRLLRASSS